MNKRAFWVRIAILALLTALTLSLHHMLLPFPHWVHLVHRRLCYVPILIGGLWFGLRGGMGVALVISAATLPLALRFEGAAWDNQDLIEIVFYLGIGFLTGFLVDLREVERRRGERLMRQLADRERLATLGQMAAGVAHEVRTPLGSIQGAAEILAEDFPEGHPRRSFFEILEQEIRRLKGVVEDFLDLGRPITVRPESLQVRALLVDGIHSVETAASEREVALESQDPGELRVVGDAARLHQALTNLIRNAVQASPPHSRVKVIARREGEGCLFTVEDAGPGLPAGEEHRLFEPFFTRRKDGTGLGLALVRQVAEAHSGWVRGESAAGGGARFMLWVPDRPALGDAEGVAP
jgi:signal transduction histidine kinase